MKTILSSFLVLLTFCNFTARCVTPKSFTSGTIHYEEVLKLDIQINGEGSAFAHLMPKEDRSRKVLYFNEESSLYKADTNEELDIEQEMEEGEGIMEIKMIKPESIIYTDIKAKKQVEQREFMTRTFLISSSIEDSYWKLTGNQKTILDYPCQEAVKIEDSSRVVAWFAPSIPVSAGPGHYGDLPGMILSVDIDDGRQIIQAITVSSESFDSASISRPTKGKKVTKEEYLRIVEEKMREAGIEGKSGGHSVTIQVTTQ